MLNQPTITIYITNCNYGKYLKTAIESAINQTYKKIDLILGNPPWLTMQGMKNNVYQKFLKEKLILLLFKTPQGEIY